MPRLHGRSDGVEKEPDHEGGRRNHQDHRKPDHQPDRRPGQQIVDERNLAEPGQRHGLRQDPAEPEHHRPEHQHQGRDRQRDGTQQHPHETRIAELADRPEEIDDKAHASSHVVRPAMSGRGRSGGTASQLPIWMKPATHSRPRHAQFRLEKCRVIRRPARQPVRAPAAGKGRSQEVVGRAGRRQHLFALGDLLALPRHADHRDRERRTLEGARALVRIGSGLCCAPPDRPRHPPERRALDHDEAPGLELAVIGHPPGDREHVLDLGPPGPRPGKHLRRPRPAAVQKIKYLVHPPIPIPAPSSRHGPPPANRQASLIPAAAPCRPEIPPPRCHDTPH